MYRDELVTLGDIFDFLEWRRVNRGIPYLTPSQGLKEKQHPAVRFYYENRVVYTVSNKGQIYRMKRVFHQIIASAIPCCSFGDNGSTWITFGQGAVTVQTRKFVRHIALKEKQMSSFFVDSSFVETQYVVRDGNKLLGVTRK